MAERGAVAVAGARSHNGGRERSGAVRSNTSGGARSHDGGARSHGGGRVRAYHL
jgi:hypothetical protein